VLNASLPFLPLSIKLDPISIGQWQLQHVLDNSISTQHELGAADKDTDEVLRLITETPLWLLGVTFIISTIHLLFDVLALKNDISFWHSAKTLKGISIRSLFIQLVSNLIITIYLYDENSSLFVLVPQACNTALFLWKIFKASGFVVKYYLYVVPYITYDEKLDVNRNSNYSVTSSADNEAVMMMVYVLTPLLIGFAFYNLVYNKFVSWYNFLLATSVAAVYGGGFILMIPQLWINYKLKSVSHLPWNVLIYRFANTFIDDMFAFIIRMPAMHRVSVFRDDIVFIIYLYQRWIYPVDSSRPAETFDDDDDTRAQVLKKVE
jgi:Cleft lip and palate transmembrane protein 1 (CLPTM1)